MSAAATRPFVGRGREMGQLTEAAADALAGRGRFLLLTGEPGIGKTRLADEIAAQNVRGGVPGVWGRSWEAGGAPAFWPWLDPLASLARAVDDSALGEALGEGAPLVAELVPEIAARLGTPPAPAAASSDEARFRLWRGVAGLVRRAAAPAGLLMIFEDLHAADRSSLSLLYFVAREIRSMRVLLIATCRDVEARLDPEAGEIISRLQREGATLSLRRLDREAAGDLLRRRTGELAPGVEGRIYASTQGNPLFLEEMARLLEDQGPDAITAGVVPGGVRDVIRQRLDRASPEARALLDLAAVAGDEIDVGLLALASARDPGAVLATVADAVRVGVLSERAGRPRFSHALVREVLYRDLEADQRRALHGVIARAIEALHPPGGVAPADSSLPFAELAYHLLEGPPAGLARAVEFAARASSRALDVLAHDEALALVERAVAAVDAAGAPPRLRAAVLLALGEARIRRGEMTAGRNACCEAATRARVAGDGELIGRVALMYGRVFTFGVVDPILVGMIEEALAALPAGDSPLRARLLARLGGALQPSLVAEEPVAVAREAIATARRLGDPRVLLETMYDGLSALMDVVDPRERLALNLENEHLTRAFGDRERLLRTHLRLAIDHLALGQFTAADARIDALADLAAEMRAPWTLWRAPVLRSVRAAIEGRFAEAEQRIAEAEAIGRGAQDPQVEGAMILHREAFLRAAERHDEMIAIDPQARRERASFSSGSAWQAIGSALSYSRVEDTEKARLHFDLLPAEMRPPVDNLFAIFSVGETIAFIGSPALAAQMSEIVAPFADQYMMLGMTQMHWQGPVTRLLALLAGRRERWEEALSYFEDAMARCRRLGARPYLARTEYELARTLIDRGVAGDRTRVRSLLDSAHQTATELGMPGLVRLVRARMSGLEAGTAGLASRASRTEIAPAVGASGRVPAAREPDRAAERRAPSLTLEGEYWTVAYEGATFRLKDSLGLRYLDRLLASPDREIHVLDLVGGAGGGAPDGQAVDVGDSGELLDDGARQSYRLRLEDLRETLAEAESFGDVTRAARAREEIDFLATELGRAVGLGGRSRRAGTAAERARSAVQRRLKNAIQRIGESAPALGAFLTRSVKTGHYCSYRPAP
jgi:tetratricopeptide (TPR) repeat protein